MLKLKTQSTQPPKQTETTKKAVKQEKPKQQLHDDPEDDTEQNLVTIKKPVKTVVSTMHQNEWPAMEDNTKDLPVPTISAKPKTLNLNSNKPQEVAVVIKQEEFPELGAVELAGKKQKHQPIAPQPVKQEVVAPITNSNGGLFSNSKKPINSPPVALQQIQQQQQVAPPQPTLVAAPMSFTHSNKDTMQVKQQEKLTQIQEQQQKQEVKKVETQEVKTVVETPAPAPKVMLSRSSAQQQPVQQPIVESNGFPSFTNSKPKEQQPIVQVKAQVEPIAQPQPIAKEGEDDEWQTVEVKKFKNSGNKRQ